tara:strand:- start:4307 stop:4894 length:588 start_codon:yes stop_codon:yes gene_type:complete
MNNTQEIAQWIVDNCICIDTETTGLGENDVVVEIAAIRIKTGEVLVNDVVKPNWITNRFAEATHGITWQEQTNGEYFGDVLETLHRKNRGDEFYTAFNLVFDERLIRQTVFRLPSPGECGPFPKPDGIICIMELANRHFAKDHAEWDNENSRFRRLSLAKCCEIAGVEFTGTAHRALADARAAADLVIAIAEGRC